MASPEQTQPSNTTEHSPNQAPDDNDSNQARSSARKDRPCPFCQQPFTSSSLGRHLDLYIKERNPKPPDGIHDVVQIRQMRSNITRRQGRPSNAAVAKSANANESSATHNAEGSKWRSNSTPASSTRPAARDRLAYTNNSLNSPALELNPPTRIHTSLNKANWQSTGVINDLPPRAGTSNPFMQREGPARYEQLRFDFEAKQKLLDEQDQRYATELALKEVLESVNAARERLTKRDIFEFDFWGTNFPGLCLRILEVPSTLFTTMATITEGSWPVQDPPGEQEADQLRRIIAAKTSRESDALQTRYMKHFNSTYSHWSSLSITQQRETYSVELMRAYASALRSQQETVKRLDKALQEASRLKTQLQLFKQVVVDSTPPWLKASLLPADLLNVGEGQQDGGGLDEEVIEQVAKDVETATGGAEADIRRAAGEGSNPRKRRRSRGDEDENMKETAASTVKGWDFDSIVNKWSSIVKTRRKSGGAHWPASATLPEDSPRVAFVEHAKASHGDASHTPTHSHSLTKLPSLRVVAGLEPPKTSQSEGDLGGGSISSGRAAATLHRSGVLDIDPTRHSRGPMQWYTGDRKQAEAKTHERTNGSKQHHDYDDEDELNEDETGNESSNEDVEMNDGDEKPARKRRGYSYKRGQRRSPLGSKEADK